MFCRPIATNVLQANHCGRQWVGMVQAPGHITSWDTGMPVDVLKFVGAKSVTVPDDLVCPETRMKEIKVKEMTNRLGGLR